MEAESEKEIFSEQFVRNRFKETKKKQFTRIDTLAILNAIA